MNDNRINTVLETARDFGYLLPESAGEKFSVYAYLIEKANLRLNLLAKGEIEHLPRRHFLDSLSPLLSGIILPPAKLLDIGSGAGLPGIPLAIAAPQLEVTMLESVSKKARFVDRAITELELANAEFHDIRIEKFPAGCVFDYCTSRAAGSISALLPLTLPHLKPKGKVVFYKGRRPESEIEKARPRAEKLGLVDPVIYVVPRELSGGDFTLVIYEKP